MAESLLARDFSTQPYWTSALPPIDPPGDQMLPNRADVAIVGGGYAGLSAALTLAQRREGRMPHELDYDTEIPALLTGARPGRQRDTDRVVVVHPGNLVGVLGLTALIHARWCAVHKPS